MAMHRRVRGALAGLLLITTLAGCGGTTAQPQAAQRSVPQTIPVPFSSVPAPVPKPARSSVQVPVPRAARYPYSTTQALAFLGAGRPVAGAMPGGAEGLATRTTVTSYEQKQVHKRKCFYEYDYFAKKNVQKCREDYVYEQVPVEKAIYVVSIGSSHRRFTKPASAIIEIVGFGVTKWRSA